MCTEKNHNGTKNEIVWQDGEIVGDLFKKRKDFL